MAYGKIYTASFDDFNGHTSTIDFYKKDYAGAVTEIICGGGAVKQSWGPDEPNAPIKGCSIEAELLNIEGGFPLSNFYSREDDTFQVVFSVDSTVKFKGFLVQDDCTEIMVDYTHNISISATDNLGLLKKVALNESIKTFVQVFTASPVTFTAASPTTIGITGGGSGTIANMRPGDRLSISGGTPLDGDYGVLEVSQLTNVVTVDRFVTTGGPYIGASAILRPALQGRYSFATVLKYALAPTNLELNTRIYSQLIPVGGVDGRLLDDTYIDMGTWYRSDGYDDCWKVINDIMQGLRATLVQVDGYWNIIRFDELRQYDSEIPGHEYDEDFVYVDDITLPPPVEVGTGSDIETGALSGILRPLKVVKEKYEYRNPYDIMRNAGFQRLGALINSYADGPDTVFEYVMEDWEQGFEWTSGGNGYIGSTAERFIRVKRTSFGEELERYGVIKGTNGMFDSRAAAQCYPIEVRSGDRIRISWDWKTTRSQPGNVNIFFIVHIRTTFSPTPRSANNRYLNQFGKWKQLGQPDLTILSSVPTGSNTNQWVSVSVESEAIPVDGLLTFKLAQAVRTPPGTGETHYRNIRFELFRSIGGNTTVEGQTHTQTQQPIINNRSDEDINIDDSPSNSFAGALMLETFTGALQDLTLEWNRGAVATDLRLGQIVTRDFMLTRQYERQKIDLTLLRADITPLTVIKYTGMPDGNFIFGDLELDYKNSKATGVLYNQYDDGEADITEFYQFKYLYNGQFG